MMKDKSQNKRKEDKEERLRQNKIQELPIHTHLHSKISNLKMSWLGEL